MKVHELAKELEVSAKDLLVQIKKLGIEAKSNFADLDPKAVEKIKAARKEPAKAAAAPKAKAAAAKPAAVVKLVDTTAQEQLAGARKVRKRVAQAAHEEPEETESAAEASPLRLETPVAPAATGAAKSKIKVISRAERKPETDKAEAPAEDRNTPDQAVRPAKHQIKVISRATPAESAAAAQAVLPMTEAEAEAYRSRRKKYKEELPQEEPVMEDEEGKRHFKRAGHGHRKEIGAAFEEEVLDEDGEPIAAAVQTYTATSFSGRARSVKWVKPKGKGKKEKSRHVFNERKKEIIIGENVSISDLAGLIGIKANDILRSLAELDIEAHATQLIDGETAKLVANEHGVDIRVEVKSVEDALDNEADAEGDLVPRSPVVTVMGHVDHGKTSLLDKIRKTNVTAGEAGGITQHIGAYKVQTPQGEVTFLDTPGHEAFTAMRARGANATDIVVLVIAAEDGPRPQTVEAINHAKAAQVPIIVAINKCDKPEANPDKVVQQLMEHGLISEAFGGDTAMIRVSAHTGMGIDKLLEMISLTAEVMELKANPKRPAEGVVVESRLDKGRGNLCTFLVQKGTLRVGDCFVVGAEFGRVRAMTDFMGVPLKEAPPSTPVEVVGLNGLPLAGETFQVGRNEKIVRQIAEMRAARDKEAQQAREKAISLENIFANAGGQEKVNLNLIIKTDVVGSMEALRDSLLKLGNEEVAVKVVHAAVGAITQSDVTLAKTSQAVIIGFNVRPEPQAKKMAQNELVDIKQYSIIYDCIEDVTRALEGLLKPVVREELQGKGEVLEVYNIPKVGLIAGIKITEGKIVRDSPIRVFRDNILIHEGTISSLRRFKDNVKEVAQGYECGLGINNLKDLRPGDLVESYQRIETQGTL